MPELGTHDVDTEGEARKDREGEARKEALAAKANDRVKRGANWADWCLIADGLAVGRVKAMRRAKTNQPLGGAYGRAFAQWMAERPWARNINKATRNHLLWVAAHRSEIEAWRETLTQRDRGRMNHPTSLRRRWDASHKPTTVREALVRELRAQIARLELRAEIARLKHMIEHCDGSLFNLRRGLSRRYRRREAGRCRSTGSRACEPKRPRRQSHRPSRWETEYRLQQVRSNRGYRSKHVGCLQAERCRSRVMRLWS